VITREQWLDHQVLVIKLDVKHHKINKTPSKIQSKEFRWAKFRCYKIKSWSLKLVISTAKLKEKNAILD
jgi:hypothetical protein